MKSIVEHQAARGERVEAFLPPDENVLEIREIWNTVRRHQWLALGVFVFIVALIGGYTLTTTPIYEASASIRIDERQSMLKELNFLAGGMRGSELSTEMEVLKSRSLATSVVDSLGLQVVLEKPLRIRRSTIIGAISISPDAPTRKYLIVRTSTDSLKVTKIDGGEVLGVFAPGQRIAVEGGSFVVQPNALKFPELRIVVNPQRVAVSRLLSSLSVRRPTRDAGVVVLNYQSADPELTRDVPNVLAKLFIARRNVVQKTEARSTTNFLRQQLDTLSKQLASTESELQAFRESQEVVNLEAEGTSQVMQLATLKAQRNDIEAQRSSLTRLLEDVERDATNAKVTDPSPYRKILAFPALLVNQTSSLYLGSLLELENARLELLARRKLDDPDVKSFTNRIKNIEGQVLSFANTYLQGLNSQAASLDTVLQTFSAHLQRIPAKEVEFARLARRPKVLEGIFATLQARLKEAEIAQAVEDPTVRVIDEAIVPLSPIKPRVQLSIAFALVFGIIAGGAVAFIRDKMDQTLHTREQLARITGLPVLGLIPRIRLQNENNNRKLLNAYGLFKIGAGSLATRTGAARPSGSKNQPGLVKFESRAIAINDPLNPVSEAYRGMRTNITFAQPDISIRTLAFTSPMPGDGKTTTTANLAITLAQQGLRVLLIDADLRKGTLNSVFGLPRDPGFSALIVGSESFEAVVNHVPLSEEVTLDFISTGPFPPNPAELLGSQRMRVLLNRLEEMYDMVIFDTPPVNLVTDAAILGTLVDGVLLVARASATHQGAVRFATEQLMNVKARVLGTVLNDVDFDRDVRYYSYNYEYAYQQYGGADVGA